MLWLRKGIVHVLAVLLLGALLGCVAAVSLNATFGHPDKLEGWLADSHIYDHVVSNALDNAQTTSQQDGNDSSVSLNDATVRLAASQALSPQFLQQSVNTFLDGNYAWLQGKTSTPEFTIDLTGPKTDFVQNIGELVQSHLAALPVCTPTQLSQLQIPVDPLAITCRPQTLDPRTEGDRVATEVSKGDFLNKPVLTAQSLSPNKDSQNQQPYYQKLSQAPRLYQLARQLPLAFAAVALLTMLGIFFIAPSRRKGLRRIGIIFFEAGVLLVLVKLVADTLIKRVEDKLFDQTFSGQLRQPYDTLLHKIASSVTQIDLSFGIAFLVIAFAIVGYLLISGRRQSQATKPSKGSFIPGDALTADDGSDDLQDDQPKVQLAPARRQPAMDVMPAQPKPLKKRPRPRLIQ